MPRERSGEIRPYTSVEGLTTYSLRLRADGERHSVRLGTSEDGWTPRRAERELQNTLVLVEKGLWEPPAPTAAAEREEPSPCRRQPLACREGARAERTRPRVLPLGA